MLILFCVCVCVCVDPTEESLPRLTTHFQQVLNAMVDSRWTHYPPPQRRRGGATRFTFDRKKLEQKMVLDSNPSCFLLQPLALRRRFREATDTLVAVYSIRLLYFIILLYYILILYCIILYII